MRYGITMEGFANSLVNSLGRRLPRMPFPPISKDANFDYESALDEQVRGHPAYILRSSTDKKGG